MKNILEELKPSKTTTRSTAEILAEIECLPFETRIARAVAIGTEIEAVAQEKWCIAMITAHRGGELAVDNPENHRGAFLQLGADLTKAANLRFLSNLLAADPDTIAARKVVDPLFEELATAQAREEQQRAELAQAEHALREAKQQAREALEATLADHPAVKAAAAKLEPFRRLGALVE